MSLRPLKMKPHLLTAPRKKPRYSVTIKNSAGEEIFLADPRAVRSLIALMDLSAVNGGAACHWGGPAAMTESWAALHAIMFKEKNWFDHFHFVNDIGHGENGIYALRTVLGYGDLTLEDLKGFRSLGSRLTGHGESHLYPEGVLLSNGPLGSALPGAQGLAVADKVLGRERVTVCSVSDGAAMEGEAKESFAAIPGLAQKGLVNPFVMMISDNNTKLGGRIDQDSFSMNPTFEALQTLGWEVIKVDDGHDLEQVYHSLEEAFEKARANSHRPVCLWIKTIKGQGIKSTAESSSGGHGFPLGAYDKKIYDFLKEIWGDKKVPKEFLSWADELTEKKETPKTGSAAEVKKEKIQAGIARGLIKAAQESYPVFSLSSDLQGSTGLKAFHKEFPERFIDVGVAEANMISTALGMSRAGLIPVVDTFAAFGITKGNLPLIMSSLSKAPLIAVFSHTGFQDAADGASHQSLTYLAALSSIPHLNVVNVASAREAEEYIYQAVKKIARDTESENQPESYVFFIGRENFPVEVKEDLSYELHRPQRLTEGRDGAIVVSGSLVSKGLEAWEKLKDEGIEVSVINHSFVNKSDFSQIADWITQSHSRLVTVEDHQLMGGMGAQLCHRLKLLGLEFDVIGLGVSGQFGQSAYSADELYSKHHLDSSAIIASVKKLQTKGSFMNFDTEILRTKWKDISVEARRKWDSLSERDLDKVKGNAVLMVSLIQQKFGISKEDASKKVEELMSKYPKEEIKTKVSEGALKAFGTAHSLIGQVKDKIKK